MLGNFTSVFIRKYHLSKRENNICHQQQYSAIPRKINTSHTNYLLRISCLIYSLLQQQAGCSRAQNLKMTANSSAVPGREPQQWCHLVTRNATGSAWVPAGTMPRKTLNFIWLTHYGSSGVEIFSSFQIKYCTFSSPLKRQSLQIVISVWGVLPPDSVFLTDLQILGKTQFPSPYASSEWYQKASLLLSLLKTVNNPQTGQGLTHWKPHFWRPLMCGLFQSGYVDVCLCCCFPCIEIFMSSILSL